MRQKRRGILNERGHGRLNVQSGLRELSFCYSMELIGLDKRVNMHRKCTNLPRGWKTQVEGKEKKLKRAVEAKGGQEARKTQEFEMLQVVCLSYRCLRFSHAGDRFLSYPSNSAYLNQPWAEWREGVQKKGTGQISVQCYQNMWWREWEVSRVFMRKRNASLNSLLLLVRTAPSREKCKCLRQRFNATR